MTTTFHGWAATGAGEELREIEFDAGPLQPREVQVRIENCGICHSDLSMLGNDWGISNVRCRWRRFR